MATKVKAESKPVQEARLRPDGELEDQEDEEDLPRQIAAVQPVRRP